MNEVIEKEQIENLIYEIRGKQVMFDSDLARLFGYETKNLNRQVQRNIERFPENYCFQLTEKEYRDLRCQNVTSSLNSNYGGRRYMPYVFTEHGITMLSGILKSEIAVKMSLKIVDTFIKMKKYISDNLLEQKYINNQVFKNTEDIKTNSEKIRLLQESFDKLSEKTNDTEIYFAGQMYDAYSKILNIFKNAKNELIIIDSYEDNVILDIIKRLETKVIVITKPNNLLTKQDIEIYNKQYNNLKVIFDNTYHDRYFIIDNEEIYHCGTSINRIGYKTFSITLMNDEDTYNKLLDKVKKMITK
ncbi:MAG: ORF6N domain-containing protein [Bacilli bacterium]